MTYQKYKTLMLFFIGFICCGCSIIPWSHVEHDGFPECFDEDQKIICDWSNYDDMDNNW